MCGCENIRFELLGSKKRQKIIVGTVYRHPQYNIEEFSQSLSETITKTAKYNCAYYVLGDISINLPLTPAPASTVSSTFLAIMRQPPELKICSKPRWIREAF